MELNNNYHLSESQMKSIMCMVMRNKLDSLPIVDPNDPISIEINNFVTKFSKQYNRR